MFRVKENISILYDLYSVPYINETFDCLHSEQSFNTPKNNQLCFDISSCVLIWRERVDLM